MLQDSSGQRLPSILSQGWTALMLTMLMLGLTDLFLAAIRNSFFHVSIHPGIKGWVVTCICASIYILMSVLVRLCYGRRFRWFNAGLMILVTVLVMVHHVADAIRFASTHHDIYHVINTTHHVIGVLMSVLAVRWARQPCEGSTRLSGVASPVA
jgi:hypothetical protein